MLTLNGKYGSARVYTDLIEQEAIAQVIEMLNQPFAENANVEAFDIEAQNVEELRNYEERGNE